MVFLFLNRDEHNFASTLIANLLVMIRIFINIKLYRIFITISINHHRMFHAEGKYQNRTKKIKLF